MYSNESRLLALITVIALIVTLAIPVAVTADSDLTEGEVMHIISDDYRANLDSIDEVDAWYEANGDDLDERDQLKVEAWLEWADSGDTSIPDQLEDEIHPDLVDGSESDSEATESNELNEIKEAQITQNDHHVMGDVTITDYQFTNQNITVTYDAESDIKSQYLYVGMSDGDDIDTIIANDFEFEEGEDETLVIPTDGSSTSAATIQTQEGYFTALSESPPPLIQHVSEYLMWVSFFAGALGAVIYAIHFFIRRRGAFDQYQPVSRVAKGMVNGSLSQELKKDEVDEDDDSVTTILKRYFSIKKVLKYAVILVIILYIVQTFGFIHLGLPAPSDYVVTFIGFVTLSYLLVSPFALAPILKALWRVEVEYTEVLDETGSTAARYVARKGIFRKRYDVDGTVPTRENEEGETVYLLSALDREDKTAEPAFGWQLDEYEPETQYVESGDNIIWIDQVLNDVELAELVVVDMFQSADEGRKIRKFLPMIRQQIRIDEGKDLAIGLSKALSGTSLEGVLSEMIDSYESKEEQLAERFESKSTDETIEEIQDLMDSDGTRDESTDNGGDEHE